MNGRDGPYLRIQAHTHYPRQPESGFDQSFTLQATSLRLPSSLFLVLRAVRIGRDIGLWHLVITYPDSSAGTSLVLTNLPQSFQRRLDKPVLRWNIYISVHSKDLQIIADSAGDYLLLATLSHLIHTSFTHLTPSVDNSDTGNLPLGLSHKYKYLLSIRSGEDIIDTAKNFAFVLADVLNHQHPTSRDEVLGVRLTLTFISDRIHPSDKPIPNKILQPLKRQGSAARYKQFSPTDFSLPVL